MLGYHYYPTCLVSIVAPGRVTMGASVLSSISEPEHSCSRIMSTTGNCNSVEGAATHSSITGHNSLWHCRQCLKVLSSDVNRNTVYIWTQTEELAQPCQCAFAVCHAEPWHLSLACACALSLSARPVRMPAVNGRHCKPQHEEPIPLTGKQLLRLNSQVLFRFLDRSLHASVYQSHVHWRQHVTCHMEGGTDKNQ